MKDKSNENALNCRVDKVLLKLKKPDETNREFVERALICLRDFKGNGEAQVYYNILVKLIKVFVKEGLFVGTITDREAVEIQDIIDKEGLA